MKISGITVWRMRLPLKGPYSLSGGRLTYDAIETTFVRIDTNTGLSGWGENCPWGHTYLPAHAAGVSAALEILAPSLIGLDPRALDAINRKMDLVLPGHLYAKSAVDIACWDILGQATGLPLWMLLGGETADPVPLNSSIATGSPEEMIARIRAASAQGYRTHSAKIGSIDPILDIERIERITKSLPDGERVTFDVNRAWTPGVAVAVLTTVKTASWVEQPCETLDQCAHVAARVSVPIMLDECLHDPCDHLKAWRLGACEGVKVKPNRLGGLTKARRVRDFSIEVGWQMHIEDVGGTALADTAALHLASATPSEYRLASWLSNDHLAIDPLSGQGVRNRDGVAIPPSVPGLGVVPCTNKLGKPYATFS